MKFHGRKAVSTLLILVALLVLPSESRGVSAKSCSAYPQYRISFPDDNVWPLAVFANMAPGSWSRSALEFALEQWNDVYGAWDKLEIGSNNYPYCYASSNNAGFSTVGWDDGSCYSGWSDYMLGVQITWENECIITKDAIFFNANYINGWSSDEMKHTAIHELGHYQYYAHNWYELSVMGYTYASTPSMNFLTAADHYYLRQIFPSGNVDNRPAFSLHRFKLSDVIVPNSVSFDYAGEPTCDHGCGALRPGDEIAATMTYENAGMGPGYNVALEMYLGSTLIGSWTIDAFPAHSGATWEFVTTVPDGMPIGFYDLTAIINPGNEIDEAGGPTADDVVTYGGFHVTAPQGWTCGESFYAAADGCDCDCGVPDPDCAYASQELFNCDYSNSYCDADGDCACAAETCGSLGLQCGSGYDDLCGGILSCGGCFDHANSFCTPSGQCACEPDSCSSLGHTCGIWEDGCGGTLDCGGCSQFPNSTCDQGQCTCQPDTCSSLGIECGSGISDQCGGVIDCGSCGAGETCSSGLCVPIGAGTDPLTPGTGVPGPEGCQPDCGEGVCGSDGCGGSCGSCPGGDCVYGTCVDGEDAGSKGVGSPGPDDESDGGGGCQSGPNGSTPAALVLGSLLLALLARRTRRGAGPCTGS